MRRFLLILLTLIGCRGTPHTDANDSTDLIRAYNAAIDQGDVQGADSLRAEILRRRPSANLIACWDTTQDRERRNALLDILYHIPNDSHVTRLFRNLAAGPISVDAYFANMYLAKLNDTIALGGGALDALMNFYPDSPQFDSPADAKNYFKNRYRHSSDRNAQI